MRSQDGLFLDLDPRSINVKREISRSEASAIVEIQICGEPYPVKLFHDNGGPGYTKNLNGFRGELKAYRNLHKFGVCDGGFVPSFRGCIDRVDPSAFYPELEHSVNDRYQPRAIVLEYLPDAGRLYYVNYSEDLFRFAVDGIKEVHGALVHHHHDIYPKNMLVLSGRRIVWIDLTLLQLSTIWGLVRRQCHCEYEVELVKSFGKVSKDDQMQGLRPNTKYF